jgi:anti-anti-sigma factor
MPADAGMENIKVETSALDGEVHEIRISGSLDWSNFAKVETAIEELFKKSAYKLVINLKNCKYISSAGFGCFISSLDTAMKHGGDIVFSSTPTEIQEVFNILGLSKILRFAPDAAAALAHFKK